MSRKDSAVREKPGPKATVADYRSAAEEKQEPSGDFWGNFIYFMVLTVAITFILVNNSLGALTSTTGMVILGILVLLDIFPIIHLVKFWMNGRG